MRKIPNFHTHTELCQHANGIPSDYVKQAKLDGCSALGISDHCPYPDSLFDYWPNIRMSTEQIPQYLSWIEEAKDIANFPVYISYECEWEKTISSWYDELKSQYKADYLVLGSHWVSDGSRHVYALDIDDNKLMSKYIDQTIDGMYSKKFAFLAHPDLFMGKYQNWDENSKAWSKAIIEAAKDLNLPLEINGLGMCRKVNQTNRGIRYAYPYQEFWELAAEMGIKKVYCNADAHHPEDVIFNAWKARDYALRFGFTVLDTINNI